MTVLMGMKHCGKTTVGRLLAEKQGKEFIDLDEYVEALFLREKGRPLSVREIYCGEGKAAFGALEAESLSRIAGEYAADKRLILALGGGTIENPLALAALARGSLFVYLDEDEDVLFRRIAAGGIPAFLDGADPRAAFHLLYEKRTALYRKKADIHLDTRGKTPEEIREELYAHEEIRHGG